MKLFFYSLAFVLFLNFNVRAESDLNSRQIVGAYADLAANQALNLFFFNGGTKNGMSAPKIEIPLVCWRLRGLQNDIEKMWEATKVENVFTAKNESETFDKIADDALSLKNSFGEFCGEVPSSISSQKIEKGDRKVLRDILWRVYESAQRSRDFLGVGSGAGVKMIEEDMVKKLNAFVDVMNKSNEKK
jgi:hypothetical protein